MKYRATKTQIESITQALESFKADCGRYPTTEEGLHGLVVFPTNTARAQWHQYMDKIPLDSWGHPYVYQCPGHHNTNTFDIYSCGKDGISQSGGDDIDDVNNFSGALPRFDPNRAEERKELFCFSAAFLLSILVVLYLGRFAKPAGNLHGILALAWILGAATILSSLSILDVSDQIAAWVIGVLVCSLVVPGILAVSGIRNGCRISKVCGWIIAFPLAILLLLLLLSALGLFPRYA